MVLYLSYIGSLIWMVLYLSYIGSLIWMVLYLSYIGSFNLNGITEHVVISYKKTTTDIR
jgi:pilus assembly protein TadC